ncbi:hypothetical protein CCS08_11845 [Escherichia coli]|uniref:Uncharacterized protein n=1 Tax=Escherichia coli TaxID=562 RepID=A0AAX0PLP4_ECOLX|nr:hypothetical protein CCS08_11845 [Escherichia coli]
MSFKFYLHIFVFICNVRKLFIPLNAYFHERRSLNNPLCQHSCRLDFYTGERLCPHMQYQLI